MLSNSFSTIKLYKSSKYLQVSFKLSSIGSPSFTLALGLFKDLFKNSPREPSTMLKGFLYAFTTIIQSSKILFQRPSNTIP